MADEADSVERAHRLGARPRHPRPLRRRAEPRAPTASLRRRAHDGGWFVDVDGSCVCGIGSCDWATHIEDCWFAPYLPSLAWEVQDVADQVSSDVTWWIDTFDADGIRIDAVPMMPRAANRRIAWRAPRAATTTPANKYLPPRRELRRPRGTTASFGTTSAPSASTASSTSRSCGPCATRWGPRRTMTEVDASITQGASAWAGSGAIMSTIIGNADVAALRLGGRGDGNGDNWTPGDPVRPIPRSTPSRRSRSGSSSPCPGRPSIYYGDEVAWSATATPTRAG